MRRDVSDGELRAALANADNKNVVASVLQMYAGVIPDDDLKSCGVHATWKALQYFDKDHPSKEKFTTYLYRACLWQCDRHLARERRERGRRTVSLAEAGDLPARDGGGDRGEAWARVGLVRERMLMLPREQREVLRHFYFDRRTHDETAAYMGITRQKVTRRLSEALARLRELCLEGEQPVYGITA